MKYLLRGTNWVFKLIFFNRDEVFTARYELGL
jgi:hypothetical protein